MDPELTEHVRRAQAGDRESFAYVVTASRGAALGAARALLGDAHAAEDAAQEACVIALDRLRELRDPAAFLGWLRALVRTSALRAQRRRREALAALDEVPDAGGDEAPLERAELRALVRAAIGGLGGERQAAVERFYLRGCSLRETAAELGLPEGTVKRLLFEARERLRSRLAGLAPARPSFPDPRGPRGLRFPL
ncbi:MAG: RNA polymerase sigma factor [Planctomycetota bacterium]